MNKLKYFPILFTIAIAVCSAPFAQAITFDFTSDHMTDPGGAGTPPFGTVTLTQDGTSVDFTVTLFDGSAFIKSGASGGGGNGGLYFLFNGTGVAVGDITNINQNFAGFTLSASSGTFHADGTGHWSFGITSNAGNGGAFAYAGPISFTVLNSTIADFTVPNDGGNLFAADILSGQTGNTGLVDVTAPGVPDGGATVMLLGAALGALGIARRFLKC
jgi:protein with PEP-CTERM/exosortase system signal